MLDDDRLFGLEEINPGVPLIPIQYNRVFMCAEPACEARKILFQGGD